jgi:hypothetical protein
VSAVEDSRAECRLPADLLLMVWHPERPSCCQQYGVRPDIELAVDVGTGAVAGAEAERRCLRGAAEHEKGVLLTELRARKATGARAHHRRVGPPVVRRSDRRMIGTEEVLVGVAELRGSQITQESARWRLTKAAFLGGDGFLGGGAEGAERHRVLAGRVPGGHTSPQCDGVSLGLRRTLQRPRFYGYGGQVRGTLGQPEGDRISCRRRQTGG